MITSELETQSVTPMMQQYIQIKGQHKDYILFYRMGDFYELFFDDAILGSKELDITLTKRGKHLSQDIPMCGVPVHASEFYLNKLLKRGYSVAICEQIESPDEAKKRGYKSLVKLEVVRIITPGTIMESILLEAKETNNLAVIFKDQDYITIAIADISVGAFAVETIHQDVLTLEIGRIMPREIVLSDLLAYDDKIKIQLEKFTISITKRPDSIFDYTRCNRKLLEFFKVEFIDGIGQFSKNEIIAAGALIEYLSYTQKDSMPRLSRLEKITTKTFMQIDLATRINLEIMKGIKSDSPGLLSIINNTVTACGSRLLSIYISSPLINSSAINARLNNVEAFINAHEVRRKVRNLLTIFPDIERALSRINAMRFNVKDLFYIRDGLDIMLRMADIMHVMSSNIQSLVREIPAFDALLSILQNTLIHDLALVSESISIVNNKFDPVLNQLYNLKNNAQNKIDQLRDKYRNITGINSLKINRNNVIGYFIEVSSSNAAKINNDNFKHKQSLGTAVRYTTDELQSFEIDIIMCGTKIERIERGILEELYKKITTYTEHIAAIASTISSIDVFSSLAELACQKKFVRPVVDDSQIFNIIGGYHPVVEASIGHRFISNNCSLHSDDKIWLITGPNMAGKSTFLRQNAIICLLAQIGSFVPAKEAHIGIIDKLFSRIGASDNISSGQSTFMIEMLETAHIANNATSKSLIIMDEVGRGTSTYDGLAIATSVVEYIHNNIGARMLFATHYHEICVLEEYLKHVSCHTMKVIEWQNTINFMHEVILGCADKSYGIHVAQLAGMPSAILDRAYDVLQKLENDVHIKQSYHDDSQCILKNLDISDSIIKLLDDIDINNITPKNAINILFQLKDLINEI